MHLGHGTIFSYRMSMFDRRPWGWMFLLVHTKAFWVKIIRVTGRTSLQSHEHRVEYHITPWRIQRIAREEKHRLDRGWYIEYAYGEPREEDIIRYEDDYGRT